MRARVLLPGFAIAYLIVATTTAVSDSRSDVKPMGSPVASCSSVSCHGGGAVGSKGSEQSTWAAGDPHASAYRILFNEESVRISSNLRKINPAHPPAHQDANCLACHSSAGPACFDGSVISNATDGVGCDSCHGPSSKWLSAHYEPSWKSLTTESKETGYGFRNTKSLVARIQACVGCHVGDATREVTHDLIAAGHPRLAFEATRYHFSAKYSKHWTESLPTRDFEIRTWSIGQVAAAKATVELVQSRADRTKIASIPWPELAEQSCFACHQSLAKPASAKSSGTPEWQAWYLAVLPVVAVHSSELFPGTTAPDLAPVTLLVNEMQKPKPDPVEARALARRADAALGKWLNAIRESERKNPETRLTSDTVRKLATAVARSAESQSAWDRSAPHYLSLAAFYHADPAAMATWREPLGKMKPFLNYPARFNSPAQYDADAVRELFRTGSRRNES